MTGSVPLAVPGPARLHTTQQQTPHTQNQVSDGDWELMIQVLPNRVIPHPKLQL